MHVPFGKLGKAFAWAGGLVFVICFTACQTNEPELRRQSTEDLVLKEVALRHYLLDRQKIAEEGEDVLEFLNVDRRLARKLVDEFSTSKLKVSYRRDAKTNSDGYILDHNSGKNGEMVSVGGVATGDKVHEFARLMNDPLGAKADALVIVSIYDGPGGHSTFEVFLKNVTGLWVVIHMKLGVVE